MADVRLAPDVIDDLDRIVEPLRQHESGTAQARMESITSALDVLRNNPLIGRPAGDDRRELPIGHGADGYLALYRHLPVIDIALVLAIRGQREAGYARP